MLKKLSLVLIAVFILTLGATVHAGNEIKVLYNNKPIAFDQPPVLDNGSTLVPLRAVFEAFGAVVNWDEATQTVMATMEGTTVKLTINSSTATINGVSKPLATPAKKVNNRTLVPLRFVGEAFGRYVDWDDATQTVRISDPTPVPNQTKTTVFESLTPLFYDNQVAINPYKVYYDGDRLVMEGFVTNGFNSVAFNISSVAITLSTPEAQLASASFGTLEGLRIAPKSYVLWTFRFLKDCVQLWDADLSAIRWQVSVHNNY